MRVSLMVEGQKGVSWEEWLALALACEEHGLEGLFRSDHYFSVRGGPELGSLDAWATLAALAARTERIRLGVLVSPVTFRHPSVLAKMAVTVDHVSEGRLDVGMGAGWHEPEHRAYGFPFPGSRERYGLLEEQVEVVHRLWDRDQEEVTFEGRHYRLERCRALPKPLQDPHPPLILGGGAGPRSVRLAARWADEYNLVLTSPERARAARDRLDAACEAGGRDPASVPLSVMTTVLVGADRGELEARARRLMAWRGEDGDVDALLAAMAETRLVGTVDQVLERLAAYGRAGVRRVMLQHLLHDDLEMVALLGRDVVPEAARL
jgi:F420-dependent oxidoreductase-like protein